MILYYGKLWYYNKNFGSVPKFWRVWGHFALNFKLGDYFCLRRPLCRQSVYELVDDQSEDYMSSDCSLSQDYSSTSAGR